MATRFQDFPPVSAAPFHLTPVAYRQIIVTNTAQSLQALLTAAKNAAGIASPYTLDSGEMERSALFSVGGIGVVYLDDGQIPTATYGQPLGANTATSIATAFSQMMLISTGANATVNVTFYR